MGRIKHWVFRHLSRLWPAAGNFSGPRGLRVLLYHCVGTRLPQDLYGTAMPAGLFREHMDYLSSLRGKWEFVPFGSPSRERLELSITFDDGYKDTLKTAAPLLVERGLPFTVFVTAENLRSPSALYLSPAELQELALLPGVLIGAHGDTHVRLDRLSDAALKSELQGSRKYLEDLLGRPVIALAYPYGAVNRRVRDAAQEAGYTLGGCSRYGLNTPERDPLLLCRTEVTAFDRAEDLALKTHGHWDWYRFRHKDPAR